MRSILVVNGERDWQEFFPGLEVRSCRLQTSRWLYQDDALWLFDPDGAVRVEAVLWRVGAIRPQPGHRTLLELLRLAGVPCVNDAAVLLRGYDRLGMINELRAAGLPTLPLSVALGEGVLDRLQPDLPAVVKVGNYHGGYGKIRPTDDQMWAEVSDLLFVSEDYVTVEPYVEYVRDIRCLAVGAELWAMARRGASWRANVRTVEYELIAVPPILAEHTRRAMEHFGADVLGIDFLETAAGEYVALENNDIPGLSGFPAAVRTAIAGRLRAKMRE
jgi:ribosomal protein S6--L-glutamate ligase